MAVLRWSWVGGVTTSGAVVAIKTDTATSNVRLRYSTSSNLSSYVEMGPQSTTSGGGLVTKFSPSGLSANMQYYYAPVVDGAQSTTTGKFRTFPSGAASFSFGFSSCANTNSAHGVFATLAGEDLRFFAHLGDIHYKDISTNDVDLFRTGYDESVGVAQQNALYRGTPIAYMWDDHDFGVNDSWGGSASRPAARQAYRENVPHYPLPAGTGDAPIYQSFVCGRVRVIMTDCRSEKSDPNASDNTSKYVMQPTQLQWFKDECLAAASAGQAIVWANTFPWIAAASGGADHWGGYTTQRRNIADFFQSNNLNGRIAIISGDMHALALDDGTNSNFATSPSGKGPVVCHGSSLDRYQSVKGGPYSHGTYMNESVAGQWVRMNVTDTGGTSISVQFVGRHGSSGTSTWQSFTFTLATGSGGGGGGGGGGVNTNHFSYTDFRTRYLATSLRNTEVQWNADTFDVIIDARDAQIAEYKQKNPNVQLLPYHTTFQLLERAFESSLASYVSAQGGSVESAFLHFRSDHPDVNLRGQRMYVHYWQQWRCLPNPTNVHFQNWLTGVQFTSLMKLGETYKADGVFVDEYDTNQIAFQAAGRAYCGLQNGETEPKKGTRCYARAASAGATTLKFYNNLGLTGTMLGGSGIGGIPGAPGGEVKTATGQNYTASSNEVTVTLTAPLPQSIAAGTELQFGTWYTEGDCTEYPVHGSDSSWPSGSYRAALLTGLGSIKSKMPTGKVLWINPADYWNNYLAASGAAVDGAHLEFFFQPNKSAMKSQPNALMDAGSVAQVVSNFIDSDYNSSGFAGGTWTPGNYADGAERARIWELALFYLYKRGGSSASLLSFCWINYWNAGDPNMSPMVQDIPLKDFNLGDPLEAYQILVNNTAGGAAGEDVRLFRREYQNGIVYLRDNPAEWEARNKAYGNSSIHNVTLPSGNQWYLLRRDGSTESTARTSIGIRLSEAVILSKGGAVAPPPLAAGTASLGTVSSSSVAVSATDASGGSTPYAYQWQRKLTTQGDGSYASVGITSRSGTDSSVASGTSYNYRLRYTDAASAVVYSNVLTASVPSSTTGTTYYVSLSGSDNNNGTSTGSAWQTLAKVSSHIFSPGDMVLFRGGDVFLGTLELHRDRGVGTASQPLTFGSFGTGRAIIRKSGSGRGLSAVNVDHLIVQDINFDGVDRSVGDVRGLYPRCNTDTVGLTIRRCNIYGWSSAGIIVGGYTGGSTTNSYRDVLLEDLNVTNCRGPMGLGAWGSTDFTALRNLTIRRCYVDGTIGTGVTWSGSGIYISGVTGFLIEQCESTKNGIGSAGGSGSGPVGIWTSGVDNGVIQHCVSHENTTSGGDGGGYDLDGATRNVTIQYCYSRRNYAYGYMFCSFSGQPDAVRDNVIRYCISENDNTGAAGGHGLFVWRNTDEAVSAHNNNVVYGCTFAVTDLTYNSSKALFHVWRSVQGMKLYNNVFYSGGSYAHTNLPTSPGVVMSGNDYRSTGNWRAIAGDTTYTSLSAFRTGSGQESGGTGTDVNPLLTSPGGGGVITLSQLNNLAGALPAYRLQEGSAMPTAGINLRTLVTLPATDFYNTSIPTSGSFTAVGAHTVSAPASAIAPAAPTSVSATASSATQVGLTWAHGGANLTDFELQRRTGTGTYGALAAPPASTRSHTDGSVSASTTYRYRIRARGAGGESAWVESNDVTTPAAPVTPTIPPAPSSLSASAFSTSQINLLWTDNSSNEDGFHVERAPDNGGAPGTWSRVHTTGANATSWSNTGLASTTRYWYRVQAFNSVGVSSFSNQTSATTQTPPQPPAAPSALGATVVSTNRIDLKWTDNSTNEEGFYVYRATTAGFTPSSTNRIASPNAGVTTYQDTSVSTGTLYYYRVSSRNAAGESAATGVASAIAQAVSGSTARVQMITKYVNTDLAITALLPEKPASGNTLIAMHFTAQATTPLVPSGWSVAAQITFSSGRTLTAFTRTAGSNESQSVTIDTVATTRHTLIVAEYYGLMTAEVVNATGWASTGTANEVGGALANDSTHANALLLGIAGVRQGVPGWTGSWGNSFTQQATISAGTDSVNYPSLAYAHRIVGATGGYGTNTSWDTPASAAMLVLALRVAALSPPPAPTNLIAVAASPTQIDLTWTDTSGVEEGFLIDRAPDSSGVPGTWTQINSVPANTTTYSDGGRTANTRYHYRVRAFNGAGNSGYTNTVSATTLNTAISYRLLWTDNSTNETSFVIEENENGGSYATIATVPAQSGSGGTVEYVRTRPIDNIKRTWRIRAAGEGGLSAPSNIVSDGK